MSRRREEFEHRTSIFEGAFRAWSHLGGLNPSDILTKSASELDPIDHPIENDIRFQHRDDHSKVISSEEIDSIENVDWEISEFENAINDGDVETNEDSFVSMSTTTPTIGRVYYYEPMPRTGLAHPFVKAILLPWLGSDASVEAVNVGLVTLRTWWQHRRKGESGSARKLLSTKEMQSVVDGYTQHFFLLAHSIVVNDGEVPPRTLMPKWKQMQKEHTRAFKKLKKDLKRSARTRLMDHAISLTSSISQTTSQMMSKTIVAKTFPEFSCDVTPVHSLEQMYAVQRLLVAQMGSTLSGDQMNNNKACCSSYTGHVSTNTRKHLESQSNGHGTGPGPHNNNTTTVFVPPHILPPVPQPAVKSRPLVQDTDKTPIVLISNRGDILIALDVKDMTSSQCVKIVERVLRGCQTKRVRNDNLRKSPIAGLLDAVAYITLGVVIIKIDKSSDAKRIAAEATRNLGMVGYNALVKEINVIDLHGKPMDFSMLSTAFDVIATTEKVECLDWDIACTCGDSVSSINNCLRHQLNRDIVEAFQRRELQVAEFMAGCAKKYGMPCNCGSKCKCKDCSDCCRNVYNSISEPSQSANTASQQQLQTPLHVSRNAQLLPEQIIKSSDFLDDAAMMSHVQQRMAVRSALTSQHKSHSNGAVSHASFSFDVNTDMWDAETNDISSQNVQTSTETEPTNVQDSDPTRELSVLSNFVDIDWDQIPIFDIDLQHSTESDALSQTSLRLSQDSYQTRDQKTNRCCCSQKSN